MPRPLSNPEWAAFMQSPNPDTLGFPPWGGIVNWGGTGQYVLCFKMPSGEWALSDISDGIPYGQAIIPVSQYLQSVPSSYTQAGDVFWNSLPSNFMQGALEFAANAGALATQITTVSSQTVGAALQSILGGISTGLSPALIPIALVAAVVLFTIYGKKG